jgi:excisionase family DNA binding protein
MRDNGRMTKTQKQPDAATGDTKLTAVPRYGSKRDVAAMLQVSVRTVDNLIAKNGCPHLKLGARRVRFDLAETRQWLADTFRTQRRAAA